MTLSCDCYLDYDGGGFHTSGRRVARKVHRCEDCGHEITPGAEYEYTAGKYDGTLYDAKTCERCADLWAALADLGFCRFTGGVLKDAYRDYLVEFVATRHDEDRDEYLTPTGLTVDEAMARAFA